MFEENSKILNRYKVLEVVGLGGMGQVYKVLDEMTDKVVALKTLSAAGDDAVSFFRREFLTLAKLRHPNLVEVHEFGTLDDGSSFFTMEFIEGLGIKEYLESQTIGEQKAQIEFFGGIIAQVCQALDYIHSRKLVHGDIKPGNILVSDRPQLSVSGGNTDGKPEGAGTAPTVKLVDFGLTRSLDVQDFSGLSGTVEYVSPEMIRGEHIDGRCDLYALGVVIYEVLAGRHPFVGKASEILRKHLFEVPDGLRKHNPDISPELESIVARLLEKDPARRYQSAFGVAQALVDLAGGKIQLETKESTESYFVSGVFVGREKELAGLKELWAKSDSQSNLVLVGGEQGIGKTRLLKELKVSTQLDDGTVIWASCVDTVTQVFRPITDVLRQVVRVIGLDSDPLKKYSTELSSLLPELSEHFASQKMPELDLEGEKLRLFSAITGFLTAVSGHRNLLVVIDDLHLADSLTIEFLTYFGRILEIERPTGILLCGVYALGEKEALTDMLAELAGRNYVETMRLDSIGLAQTNAFISSMLGKDSVEEQLCGKIYQQTEGNPFFIEELMKSLVEEGTIVRKHDVWEIELANIEDLKLPSSVKDVMLKRIHSLDKKHLHILRSASVWTDRFDLEMLRYLTDSETESLLDVLRDIERAEIIWRTGNAYSFKTNRIRDILYEGLDDGEKRDLNRKAAAFYEIRFVSDPDQRSELFAHHYYYAGEFANALKYCLVSGDRAVKLYANSEAVNFYERALGILHDSDVDDLPLEFELLTKMMDVYDVLAKRDRETDVLEEMLIVATRLNDKKRLSEMYNKQARFLTLTSQFDHARKSAEKALNLKRAAKDRKGEGEAFINLGFAHYRKGSIEDFLKYYDQAIVVFDELQCKTEEGNALVDVGYAYAAFLDTPKKALEYYDKALSLFEDVGNERGKARALGNSGLAYYFMGEYEKALECYHQAHEIFQRIGDRRGLANALNNMGLTLKTLGRYSPSLEHLARALKLMREIKDTYGERGCLEHHAIVYEELGQYNKSLEYFEAALLLAQQIGGKSEVGSNYQNMALVHHHLGKDEVALEYLAKALAIAQETGYNELTINTHFTYALIYLARKKDGDLDSARKYADDMIALSGKLSFRALEVELLSLKAMIYFESGDTEKAMDFSTQSVALLSKSRYIEGNEQEVYWNHYRILGFAGDERATDYLKDAYNEVERKSASISEDELRASFMEVVELNRNIINAYNEFIETGETMPYFGSGKEKNLATLYEVSKTINSILELDNLLDKIMDLALDTMHGERGMIFLLEGTGLRLRVARNVEKETIQDATEISESIMRDVVSGGKSIIAANAQEDERFRQRLSVLNFQIVSLVCVPLKLKERIIGTVYIDSRMSAVSGIFSKPDVDFLEAFANMAAVAIENARLHEQLKAENIYLRREVEEKFGFESIIGQSKAMHRVYEIMQGAINSDGTVLIEGPSGTGKELIAKAIHYNSVRKTEKFLAVDCAALTETLLDSELFGHKKGSFTGAVDDKVGFFEEADGGTIFLDEITNTSPALQAKLLRVLQEGEIRRVGDTGTRKVDVHVIAATNKSIEQEVERGHFRQDLYYRLNVIPIVVPQLRERSEDIPFLVQHFIDKYNPKIKRPIKGMTKELMDELVSYEWPGNVRELENLINRMMIFAAEDKLSIRDLPGEFKRTTDRKSFISEVGFKGKIPTLDELERDHIARVLEKAKGNKTEAAKLLGLKRTTLIERMKKLKIS
jgi:Nif-specific regulatory protein